jgi:hypothetical protein
MLVPIHYSRDPRRDSPFLLELNAEIFLNEVHIVLVKVGTFVGLGAGPPAFRGFAGPSGAGTRPRAGAGPRSGSGAGA